MVDVNCGLVLMGLVVGVFFGFEDIYVFVMCDVDVECEYICMFVDLVMYLVLWLGLLYEFFGCVDGWLVIV